MNASWIRAVWERKGFGATALWLIFLPISSLYFVISQLRDLFYSRGWLRCRQLPKPVISVGNLTVGGTGKTPSCLWLAQELAKRGQRVAILSRGYKRKNSKPLILQPGEEGAVSPEVAVEVTAAGDEPLMMAQLYGQIVGVGKNRHETGEELLRRFEIDVFILDDGYQHRQIRREVDLLVLGNDARGWVLPSGPFREPRNALGRADFYLLTAGDETWKRFLPPNGRGGCFAGALEPVNLIGFESNRLKEHPLSLLYRSKILTVTGVANPKGLYRMIHEWDGEIVDTLEFPDHHYYTARDWQQISRMARLVDLVVTTEKDILKLVQFPFAKDKLLALRVAMKVEKGEDLVRAMIAKIEAKSGATST
jgi:tetraacyldisaccharide 4'-kinase